MKTARDMLVFLLLVCTSIIDRLFPLLLVLLLQCVFGCAEAPKATTRIDPATSSATRTSDEKRPTRKTTSTVTIEITPAPLPPAHAGTPDKDPKK